MLSYCHRSVHLLRTPGGHTHLRFEAALNWLPQMLYRTSDTIEHSLMLACCHCAVHLLPVPGGHTHLLLEAALTWLLNYSVGPVVP